MDKEELDLLEIVFTLAIGECAYNDINNIQKLEDKIKTIGNLCKKQKEVIDKINNYIDNYDIFKVFSFPLMKRWEEEQVKSSIDYEFKTSLIKNLKDILKEVSE